MSHHVLTVLCNMRIQHQQELPGSWLSGKSRVSIDSITGESSEKPQITHNSLWVGHMTTPSQVAITSKQADWQEKINRSENQLYIYIWCTLGRKRTAWSQDIKRKFLDFPGGPVVKNLSANTGDTGSTPGPGRSHVWQSNDRAPQLLSPGSPQLKKAQVISK